ncbi:RNA polymerase sigma-70 factor [Plebeiibacterium sediminum]|uniref:RNA polymerase sigma-70 factor n=1 Tax=Plebeiibacterium sediminum TaxID=2992112 RepID=A0AAE3M5C4_9BACT|nr:RNA polymerase sigma-70 factor [Plebeiobacterium sediminum]MCW3787236.1 RNA polymerase sigma-70 factor [Plebeiobacterium sediminum]
MDDKDLLNKLSSGDEAAFEQIFILYYQPLVVFANKLVYDMDMARDLVQGVIVHFYEKRQEIQIHTSLKAHLYQSVRNRCLNHLKREQTIRNHHSSLFVESKEAESVFHDIMEETELEHRIFQIIKSLPKQCQKIFEMSRFQGKTNQDIADELSISKRTVETQISNALKKMRQKLAPYIGAIAIFALISAVYLVFS